jgi:anti-sigma factor RsiW
MHSNLHIVAPEDLMAYLEGELRVDRAAEIAAHLPECRECQILAAELKSVSEGLTAWAVESKEPQLNSDLAQALDKRERRLSSGESGGHWNWLRTLRSKPFGPWIGGVLAGGLAAVLLVFMMIGTYSREERSPTRALRQTETSQHAAEPQAIPLPGGDRDRLPAPMASVAPQSANELALLRRRQEADLASNLEVNSNQGNRSSAVTIEPMILRTAQLTLVAPNFDKARAEMDQILQRHQGYVGDLTVSSPSDGPRKLTATLRVPSTQMDAALTELKTLGRVESESQNGQDVTAQYVDLEARLTNARNTEQRLTDLLRQRTGKLSDVLEVETELSRVRGEIEQMEAERRLLSKQVEFATLTATVTEEYKAQAKVGSDSLGNRFRNAAIDGYQSVVNFVIDVALFLISWGPSLLLWAAILFFPARFAWRKYRSH